MSSPDFDCFGEPDQTIPTPKLGGVSLDFEPFRGGRSVVKVVGRGSRWRWMWLVRLGWSGAFLRWSEASLPPPQFCLTQPWSRCSSEILRRHGEYLQFTYLETSVCFPHSARVEYIWLMFVIFLPTFFGTFSRSSFLVNKTSLFLPKCQ